jgi:glycosyltransferase involved in cell wall biosynthesis
VRPRDWVDGVRMLRRWRVDGQNLARWRQLDRIVVPSDYMADLARQHGLAAERLRVVPHGADVGAAERRSEVSGPPCIVYLGALVGYKGPQMLVDALAELRDLRWRAVLAGDGPLRDELVRRLDRSGLADRVQFVGPLVDRHEVDALLASARLAVLPSIIAESFGMAGLEALAVGTPVVSFGLGGVAQWLRDGENGFRVASCTATALAESIRRLLESQTLADELGRRGRDLVRREFGQARATERLRAVYAELVGAC